MTFPTPLPEWRWPVCANCIDLTIEHVAGKASHATPYNATYPDGTTLHWVIVGWSCGHWRTADLDPAHYDILVAAIAHPSAERGPWQQPVTIHLPEHH